MTISKTEGRVPADEVDARARAALTLLDALLLSLMDRGVLGEKEIDEVFEDAISAHGQQSRETDSPVALQVERVLRRMQARGNGSGDRH